MICLKSKMVFILGAVSLPYGGTDRNVNTRETECETGQLTLLRVAKHAYFLQAPELVKQVLLDMSASDCTTKRMSFTIP